MSQQNGNVLRRPTGNHIEQGTEAVRPNHVQSHIHDSGYAGRLLRIPGKRSTWTNGCLIRDRAGRHAVHDFHLYRTADIVTLNPPDKHLRIQFSM